MLTRMIFFKAGLEKVPMNIILELHLLKEAKLKSCHNSLDNNPLSNINKWGLYDILLACHSIDPQKGVCS